VFDFTKSSRKLTVISRATLSVYFAHNGLQLGVRPDYNVQTFLKLQTVIKSNHFYGKLQNKFIPLKKQFARMSFRLVAIAAVMCRIHSKHNYAMLERLQTTY